jgi:hypothetical protein
MLYVYVPVHVVCIVTWQFPHETLNYYVSNFTCIGDFLIIKTFLVVVDHFDFSHIIGNNVI